MSDTFICRFVDGVGGSTVLDINDQAIYWITDESSFPLPEVVYSWVENSHGRSLADWHLGGRTITLNVWIAGDDRAEAYENFRTLMAQLLKENTLEVSIWGAEKSIYFHTYPTVPKTPELQRNAGSLGGVLTSISFEVPVDAEVKASEESFVVFEPLGINDDFELGKVWTWSQVHPLVGYGNWGGTLIYSDGLACDSDVSVVFVHNNADLYLSTDGGDNFEVVSPGTMMLFSVLACDDDGSVLVAAPINDDVQISTNGGDTWSDSNPWGPGVSDAWDCLDCDSDGSVIILGAGAYGGASRLWLSTNTGSSWSEMRPAGDVNKAWKCCACDSDGSVLVAGVDNGRLYLSTNTGSSWSEVQPAGNYDKHWYSVAVDSDGTVILAGEQSGRLWLSTNTGSSWAEVRPAGDVSKIWTSVSCSSDGAVIIACAYNGRVYVSHDTGSTWQEVQPEGDSNKKWTRVLMDANGDTSLALYESAYSKDHFFKGFYGGSGWTETETNSGTATVDDNRALSGTYSYELATTAGGTDVAAITDSAYITVDASKYHQLQVFAYEESGAAKMQVQVLCYSISDTLLGTLNLVTDYNPAVTDVWVEACETGGDGGVINPIGGATPAFPTGTVKVKRKITNNSTAASVLCVDRLWFGCTEYSCDHKLSGVVGIHVPPEDLAGDLEAKMDVHLGVVYDRPADIILGQRKEYSADFNPVQEPTTGTEVADYQCRSGSRKTFAAITDLVDDGGFEQYTGSGNTTNWDHWAETRSGYSGAMLGADTVYKYAGSACMKIGTDGTGTASCAEEVLSDYITVDPLEMHGVSFRKRFICPGGIGFMTQRLELAVKFYNVSSTYLGEKTIFSGVVRNSSYSETFAYVNPDDFPTGTTKVKIWIKGTMWSALTSGGYFYIDAVSLGEAPQVEANFPVDSHYGKAYAGAGVSLSDTTTYDTLLVQTLLETIPGEEIVSSVILNEVDLGNPNTKLKEIFWLSDRVKFDIPSHGISSNANPETLAQLVRLSSTIGQKDLWVDYIMLNYYCGGITIVTNWADKNNVIFDSRSSGMVLVSLDGTLDTAQSYDHNNWRGPCVFKVNPNGLNMTLNALKDTSGDQRPLPVMSVRLVYNPSYLLVAT